MRKARDFYPELIEKLSRVNRRRMVRVNISDRYQWSERYGGKKTLKPGEEPKDKEATA